jgi:virginiamycin B lyase
MCPPAAARPLALTLALLPLCLGPRPAHALQEGGQWAASSTTATADAGESPEVREWPVPWADSRPRDPYLAPDGKVWFVGQRGDYLAWLDPATGAMERRALPAGTGPHNLILDGDGRVWYAGNRVGNIGTLVPGGTIETIPMPDPAVRDPHTLVFGRAGEIWFTAQGANRVGRLDPRSREVKLIAVPTPNARPYGIVVDGAGRPWLTLFGSPKLATVDPRTLALVEIELPRPEARPRRLAATADGAIWYVDYAAGFLGRYDPRTKAIREWPVPGGRDARPYAMAADDRGRLWLVETGAEPNRLMGFDPESERFFAVTPLASGGGSVRHMVFHAPTRALWFGTDANTIGRARLP